MKNIFLLICALAFVVTNFMSVAYADVPNPDCKYHTAEVEKADENCSALSPQDETELEHCQDCCCIHTHIITSMFDALSTCMMKEATTFTSYNKFSSKDLSSLNRPPIS